MSSWRRCSRTLLLNQLRRRSGQMAVYTASMPMSRNKSRIRITTNEYTNALVAARPTPSAPGSQWKPRWQLIRAIAAPKNRLLKMPVNRSQLPTKLCEFCPVVVRVDVQNVDAVERAADDAHEVGHDRERGNQQEAAEEPRHDEVVDRVGAHAGQGVDLLGDAHRAQLGGHGAADAAGQHRGGQHRAQLADQRHVDDRAQPRFQAACCGTARSSARPAPCR